MNIKQYLSDKRSQVETELSRLISVPDDELAHHIESLNYSLQAGGKRVRPILCIAAAEALGASVATIMHIPCALECIHTYSLIHDDLPALDNDALRRGKPTNHMVYGEAGAILAGDGLLTLAFELLSRPALGSGIPDKDQLRIINIIARSIGSLGMVGGQALDIDSEQKDIPFQTLQKIHSCKTGALITASVQTGAILGKASEDQFHALTKYGTLVGLAFQIVDDLLNVEGTTEQLGKAAGSDAARDKATYPAFFGLEKTHEMAKATVEEAVTTLQIFDSAADPLRKLATYIYTRTR